MPERLLPQLRDGDTVAVLLCIGAIALFAAGYFFLCINGYRASRSLGMRALAVVFTAFQLGSGALAMRLFDRTEVILLVAPLLCFSIFVLISFAWPGARNRAYRPLRRREGS